LSSHAARARPLPRLGAGSYALPRVGADAPLTIVLGAGLAALAFAAQGGLLLGRTTIVELILVLVSGAVAAACALVAPREGAVHGVWSAALFVALAGWTIASISWAVAPSDAWIEANRTLTYLAVFAAALAAVRAVPLRWPAVLGAVALGALAVAVYALLTKVFPGALNPDEIYARLRAPYGYWNAVGLTAAMGIPAFLWLGARRHGHAALNVAAYPGIGLLFVTLMLAYSRGALLALAVGLAFWFAFVPLRLRGAAVLIASLIGAALVVAWTFSQDALSQDHVPIALRVTAGHQLGLLLVALVLGLTAVGLLAGFASATRAPTPLQRRRAGAALLCALALVPIVLAVALSETSRGLTGSISHGWHQLTDPNAVSPSNAPGRLTSVGSVRARYWSEALRMFRDHAEKGVGAGGYATARPRYRRDTLDVRHAHGYGVQTLADLGWIGGAISLALLAAWLAAALVSTGLLPRDRGRPYPPERVGLLTMVAIVVVFGVHSFVDWTWFIPGNAVVAILLAGWVAGRGPLAAEAAGEAAPAPLEPPDAWRRSPVRLGLAVGSVALALVAAWAVWQPQRSQTASDAGFDALAKNNLVAARADAQTARSRDPLALDPLTVLSIVQQRSGDKQAALESLRQAVRMQPANSQTWLALGTFQADQLHRYRDAKRSMAAAVYLDPRNPDTIAAYLDVLRRATGKQPGVVAPAAPASPVPPQPSTATG